MQVNVHVYAKLKEFFKDKLTINISENANVEELKNKLIKINPDSKGVLSVSKMAVNNEFINEDYILKNSETIFLFPPSSGG